MSSVRSLVDRIMNWIAINAKFSYLLPDTLEIALYLCLAAYSSNLEDDSSITFSRPLNGPFDLGL
jgi:hypothetical protein